MKDSSTEKRIQTTDAKVGGKNMEEVIPRTTSNRKKAAIKASMLAVFIIVAIYLVRFSPVKGYLTVEALGGFLDAAGFWAPVAFVLFYAAGICLFLPGTLLTGIVAVIFGPYWGFLYVWTGAVIGANIAFWIGRTLGRDFAASLIGDRLKKYDDFIERQGFAATLYMRLLYVPFTAMNFGMGLTRVRFWDYFFGTGLGIIPGTFIFTLFAGTLKVTIKEAMDSGNWGALLSFKIFFVIGLFIFSFFIPKIIKKIKGEE
jgi:uncharacterized membrane protein YdjX (TVP38/TMEM64 family)